MTTPELLDEIASRVAAFFGENDSPMDAACAILPIIYREREIADALADALRVAIEWDSHDSEDVAAVWLEQARAALATYEAGRG